jgi:hypothetical protein
VPWWSEWWTPGTTFLACTGVCKSACSTYWQGVVHTQVCCRSSLAGMACDVCCCKSTAGLCLVCSAGHCVMMQLTICGYGM